MKKILSLFLTLIVAVQAYIPARAFGGDLDDPIDIVVIYGGRTFDDATIDDLVTILGGRIRKIKRGNKKTYVTLELDNTEKHLHAFGGIGPISPPEPDGSSDILRVNGVR